MRRTTAALLCLLSALCLLLTGCGAPKAPAASGGGELPSSVPAETVPAPALLTEAEGAWFSTVLEDYVADTVSCSDGWFDRDPAEDNPGLALCSMQLVCAASDESHGTALLEALGFSDVRAVHYTERSADACAFTSGTKTVLRDGTSCTLRAVMLQSAIYDETGWEQNFRVNDEACDGPHRGYEAAAAELLSSLPAGEEGKPVIWWLAGYSRGGAIAGMTAAALIDRGETVFACTFASPACTDAGAAEGGRYRAIHNYLCDDDPVPMTPLWGMERYGQDYSLGGFPIDRVRETLQAQSEAALLRLGDHYDGTWQPGGGGVPQGDYLRSLLKRLEREVPTRADYSLQRRDPYSLDGTAGEAVWSPQEALLCLVRLAAGPGLLPSGSTEETTALLQLLVTAELETQLAAGTGDEALAARAAGHRWQLAGSLCSAAAAPGVTREGVYGILALASPLLVNAEPVLKTGKLPDFTESTPLLVLLPYAPGFSALLQYGDALVFSHHSDTLVARLKLLAARGD